MKHVLSVVLAVVLLTGIVECVPPVPASGSPPVVSVERVDTSLAWASPCWGYNAPKIVRNASGEMWAVNFFGKYGGQERARILKRTPDGRWIEGAVFDSLYQPSMIFLDGESRLNYVQNSQYLPIRHYRSADDENLHDFTLVASGNGIADGRGWYVGVAVRGNRMYMAYVTLTYDLYYTWKDIQSPDWHPAILVEAGVVDTAKGNHSWLYPRFVFSETHGFITTSSTVDGSKQNTYNSVCLASFPLASPEKFTKEIVYDGAVGYYSYCYDVVGLADGTLMCAFNAGRYRYGPKRDDVLPAGLYLALRNAGDTGWAIQQVDDSDGGLAIFWRPDDGLYALVNRGGWDRENHTLLKRSTDRGKTWTTVVDDVMAGYATHGHQFFAQGLRLDSGSTLDDGSIHVLLTDHDSVTPVDGLYRFDLLHLSIRFP